MLDGDRKGAVLITNEEMAIKIQKGETGYIPVLWDKVYRFIDAQAGMFLDEYPDHYKQYQEDMVNEAYFAFLKAIDGYEEGKGKFLTYLGWKIKNTFREAVGIRGRREVLNEAESYDVPLNDTDDLPMIETLCEERSTPHKAIEEAECRRGIRAFLDEALQHVTDDTQKRLIRYMYSNGCGLTEANRKLYGDIPVPANQHRKALTEIRRFCMKDSTKNKFEYWGLDDFISCKNTSVSSFKKSRFTSSVESIVLKRERIRENIIW